MSNALARALLDVPLTAILIHMCSGGGDHTWWFSMALSPRKIDTQRFIDIRFSAAIGAPYGPYTWDAYEIMLREHFLYLYISFFSKNIFII